MTAATTTSATSATGGEQTGEDAAPAYDTAGIGSLIREISDPADLADFCSAALSEAYELATRRGQAARTDPLALTISALGGCTRQAAYRLAGTPPSDPDLAESGQNRAAHHGTWLDRGLMPLLAEATGGRAQVPVTLTAGDEQIPGTADLVVPGMVLDLKTVRESRLAKVIGAGPFESNRMQGLGYALALHQQGEDVDWVAFLYLDRATGQEHPVCERFTQTSIMIVLRRVWEIQRHARRPDWAPRTERGPGHSWSCDSCPWLRRCWGGDARPGTEGPQRRLGRDHAELARVLADYQRLGTEAGEIKKERDFLKAVFTHGCTPGDYGDLRWYRTSGGDEPDTAAMVEILDDLGIDVPRRPKSGQVRVGPAKRERAPRKNFREETRKDSRKEGGAS